MVAPDPTPEPSDSLLAEILAELEHDEAAAEARLSSLDPALAARVRALLQRLHQFGLAGSPRRIGRFRLEQEIGRGSMGVVWRARDEALDREVAVKVIAAHVLANQRAAERFQREARAIATLRHPGILTAYELGEDQGLPYLVLELVAGGSLADRLSREPFQALTPDQACRVGIAVADALQAAHDAGIVHRDVKPSNILLRESGAPLLGDFGLACIDGDESLTATGDLLGTPAYAAPEMLQNGVSDARSDLYSLGATVFHALTGRPPFRCGNLQALIRATATGEAPRLRTLRPDLPIDWEAVLAKALDSDPRRRYASARELGAEFSRLLHGEPVHARQASALSRGLRWIRRRPALASAIGVPVLLSLFALVGFLLWQSRELARFQRLADVHVLGMLEKEFSELWSRTPDLEQRFESWLTRAQGVLDRAEHHAHEKRRVAALASSMSGGSRHFADDTLAWQHRILQDLELGIAALRERLPIVQWRSDRIRRLEEITLTSPRARESWERAIATIRVSPRYAGLELRARIGLLPLGENPETGLWEFWHPLTGEEPRPAPTASPSRWIIAPETGAVFVLVPGGTYTVGAKPPSAEQPLGSPYIDDELKAVVGIDQVELEAYFLSKYEMTQGQWLRLTGESPSHFDPARSRGIGSLAHPVESISWDDATRVARRVGLALPTDVQWEVAYRGGSSTRFPRGDAPSSLYGTENLQDRSWYSRAGYEGAEFEDTTDGFPGTAPVGTFRANALGFHDMGGNVAEPCADDWEDYVLPPRTGDGLIGLGTGGPTVGVRGASWADTSAQARAGRRDAITRDKRSDKLGVRVVFP